MQNKRLIIGLKGLAGSGKDTVANYLVKNHQFTNIKFATPLKQIVSIISGWPIEMVSGETEDSRVFRETVVHPTFKMTGREMLQQIGTELFREHFHKDVWMKICEQTIVNSKGCVVISDVRFENEVKMIQNLGGYIWNVNRNVGLQQVPAHASEQLFDTHDEIFVDNNGTIEQLYANIDKLIVRY